MQVVQSKFDSLIVALPVDWGNPAVVAKEEARRIRTTSQPCQSRPSRGLKWQGQRL